MSIEEVSRRIRRIGKSSSNLEFILNFFLNQIELKESTGASMEQNIKQNIQQYVLPMTDRISSVESECAEKFEQLSKTHSQLEHTMNSRFMRITEKQNELEESNKALTKVLLESKKHLIELNKHLIESKKHYIDLLNKNELEYKESLKETKSRLDTKLDDLQALTDELVDDNHKRSNEVRGLKEVIIRENEQRLQEIEKLQIDFDTGLNKMGDAVDACAAVLGQMELERNELELSVEEKHNKLANEMEDKINILQKDLPKKESFNGLETRIEVLMEDKENMRSEMQQRLEELESRLSNELVKREESSKNKDNKISSESHNKKENFDNIDMTFTENHIESSEAGNDALDRNDVGPIATNNIETHATDNKIMTRKVDSVASRSSKSIRSESFGSLIAFSAYRKRSLTSSSSCILTFDSCTLNIGQALNPSQGLFKCPLSGLYLFFLHVCCADNHKCWLSIRKNDNEDCGHLIRQDGERNRGMISLEQHLLIYLQKNDQICIHVFAKSGIVDHEHCRVSKFSGLLLAKDH